MNNITGVILTDNRHRLDYWSRDWITTWMLLENDGTKDIDGTLLGGKIIAEFRSDDHAIAFANAMGWSITT